MSINKIISLLFILSGVAFGIFFLLWIIILPILDITEIASRNILSGYWGIAVFTILEILVVSLILVWVGLNAFKAQKNN